jgi:hypothetical protein
MDRFQAALRDPSLVARAADEAMGREPEPDAAEDGHRDRRFRRDEVPSVAPAAH